MCVSCVVILCCVQDADRLAAHCPPSLPVLLVAMLAQYTPYLSLPPNDLPAAVVAADAEPLVDLEGPAATGAAPGLGSPTVTHILTLAMGLLARWPSTALDRLFQSGEVNFMSAAALPTFALIHAESRSVAVAAAALAAQWTSLSALCVRLCLQPEVVAGLHRLLSAPVGADAADAVDGLEYVEGWGSDYGLPVAGALDGVMALLLAAVTQDAGTMTAAWRTSSPELWEAVARRVESLSISNSLSVTGVAHCLALVAVVCRTPSLGTAVPNGLTDALVMGLIALLRESKLRRVVDWPEAAPWRGGRPAVSLIVDRVCAILSLPFGGGRGSTDEEEGGGGLDRPAAAAAPVDAIDEDTLSRLQSIMYNQLCIRHAVATWHNLNHMAVAPAKHFAMTPLAAPVHVVCRLVCSSNYFVQQFLNYGGLAAVHSAGLLQANAAPPGVLVDVLTILSQVARVSKDNYDALAASPSGAAPGADLLRPVPALLRHAEASVRAKAANLIGNLARHSAFFYPMIASWAVLPPLLDCCREANAATRKFACFAVGNAAFHNDSLYAAMRPCVPWLSALLRYPLDTLISFLFCVIGSRALGRCSCVSAGTPTRKRGPMLPVRWATWCATPNCWLPT